MRRAESVLHEQQGDLLQLNYTKNALFALAFQLFIIHQRSGFIIHYSSIIKIGQMNNE